MGDEVERPALGLGAAEPFRRRDPSRVSRAIRIIETGDGLGNNLDAPRGRLERMALGVASEILEQDLVALWRRQLDEPFRPELLESG